MIGAGGWGLGLVVDGGWAIYWPVVVDGGWCNVLENIWSVVVDGGWVRMAQRSEAPKPNRG